MAQSEDKTDISHTVIKESALSPPICPLLRSLEGFSLPSPISPSYPSPSLNQSLQTNTVNSSPSSAKPITNHNSCNPGIKESKRSQHPVLAPPNQGKH